MLSFYIEVNKKVSFWIFNILRILIKANPLPVNRQVLRQDEQSGDAKPTDPVGNGMAGLPNPKDWKTLQGM